MNEDVEKLAERIQRALSETTNPDLSRWDISMLGDIEWRYRKNIARIIAKYLLESD